jgi:hypothetical protein
MEKKLYWQIQNLTKSELNNIPGHKVRRFCDHRYNGQGQYVYWYECECGYTSAKCLNFNSARARLLADHLTRVYMKLNYGVEW